ncbi:MULTISPECIES: hypothetical protein [Stenotrophomonas]|uniref:hypothetical protein n=1 Tax=Stenotrophomonas geniculata TaxID=86188 RepID=UPI00131373B1
MSNDNKTLADVQPGGRVRLGDGPTIEKQARDLLAKEWEMLSFDAPVEELREGCELPPVVAASVRAIVAALSAHSFPDGQRDNSDLLAALRDVEEYLYYAGSNSSHTETVRAAINALSAQPSPGGQGDALEAARELLAAEYDKAGERVFADRARKGRYDNDPDMRAIIAALAARQPVGEPVGYATYRDGRFGSWLFQTRAMAESHDSTAVAGSPANSEIVPLFRSPAPAVDLGDFKALYRAYVRLLESGRDRIRDLGGACDPVDVMEANDVDLQAARRVIDSKAVGK